MIEELEYISNIKVNPNLKKYNTFRLDSSCEAMVFPSDVQELKSILFVLKKYNKKYFVIGNGSNIILPSYYDGVIVKLDRFNKRIITGTKLYAEAGVMINRLADETINLGLSGLEWAVSIPGTVGGCIYNNAGAYKGCIKDTLLSAIVFDGNKIIELSNKALEFDYRESILKKRKDLIVLSAIFELNKKDIKVLKKLVKERTKKRLETQDLSHPSCGSVFRNPKDLYAGKLIEDVGLKGYCINDAKVSDIHANFIINSGDASSTDIIKLIKKIQKEVKIKYNVDLILEQEIKK